MAVTTRVEGLAELGARMRALSQDMATKVLKSAATAGANKIRDEARRIARAKGLVKTGAMVKAISVRRDKRASRAGYEVRGVSVWQEVGGRYANTRFNRRKMRVGKQFMVDAPEFYWKFHELGTVKMAARPFIRPALMSGREAAVEAIKRRLKARLDKAGA